MTFISLFICVFYALLILSFIWGFEKIPLFGLKDHHPKTTFSIIIPFRNEENNLPQLLESIHQLKYPKELFEILLVNDESEDQSIEIINAFCKKHSLSLTILDNERKTISPKKDAITRAIKRAKNTWILTTDADCILPKNWLLFYNSFIQENKVDMICGPVNYIQTKTFLDAFQKLELLSLIGATIGGFGIDKPFMCNGANLGYTKAFFNQVNGFSGNTTIASGDDMFLLEKALKHNKYKVKFLKSEGACVLTKSAADFKSVLQQRIRWASKTTHFKNSFGKIAGLIIFLMNFLLLILLVMNFLNFITVKILLAVFILKFYLDFWLISKVAIFFKSKKTLYAYFISSFSYPFFSVLVVINSTFSSYEWKGRHFKK